MPTRVTAAQIEEALDAVLADIEYELRTPPEQRGADTYERLALLHRQEALAWKAYLETLKRRVAWTAACAAADRAHRLAAGYEHKAVALLQDSGQLWPAEYVVGEVA